MARPKKFRDRDVLCSRVDIVALVEDAAWRLRQHRAEHGLSQAQVANQLGISRSTLANIEAGRQGMTMALRAALDRNLPGWDGSGGEELDRLENPGLVVEELSIVYVFEASASPSEMIQTRRVRAVRSGVSRYRLALCRTDQQPMSVDTHVLWGGFLTQQVVDGEQQIMTSVDFGRQLGRGETVEFALRSWMERDPEPDTSVWVNVTQPTKIIRIHLTCLGPRRIRRAWTQRLDVATENPLAPPDPVEVSPDGGVSAHFEVPEQGVYYTVSWDWLH